MIRGGFTRRKKRCINWLALRSLQLDFATTSSLTSAQGITLAFSRASGATQIDSQGNMVFAPENLFLQSEDITNASWTKTNATATLNPTTPPTGITNCGKIAEDNTINYHFLGQVLAHDAGINYTMSAYLKASERTFAQISLTSGGFGVNAYANFNLSTGVVSFTGSACTAAITSVGNGWYRCSVSALATATTAGGTDVVAPVLSGTATRGETSQGVTGSGIFVAGLDMERSTSVRAYNPTTSSAYYGPRFDYYPNNVTYSGQNLFQYSQEFDNAYWTKADATITANTTANPLDGAINADTIVEGSGVTTQHRLSRTINTEAVPTTLSIYVKRGVGTRQFQLGITSSPVIAKAYFNLDTGTVGYSQQGTATITSVGNGWYRCSLTATIQVSSTTQAFIAIANAATNNAETYTGDGVSSLIYFGAQLELTSAPSVYLPTSATASNGVAIASPRGLCMEEARTNLCTFSRDPSNVAWVKTDTTVTSNTTATLSPEGVNNATLLTEGVAGTAIVSSTAATITANDIVTASLLVKRGNTDWIRLILQDSGGSNGVINYFNLASGTVGSSAIFGSGVFSTANIVSLKNGWYIISVTGQLGAIPTTAVISHSSATADNNSVRVNNATRYVLDAQLEISTLASSARRTSIIPTTSASVTRVAEICWNASISGWYNQTEGTIDIDWEQMFANTNAAARGVGVSFDDNTSNNLNRISTNAASGLSQGITTTGGVGQAGIASSTLAANTIYKSAYTYKLNDFAFAQNGVLLGTDTSGTVPTVTQVRLGQRGGDHINGWIRNLSYYPIRLPNTTLQVITT